MRKFECNNCPNRHCYTENTQNDKPKKCLFDDRDANWNRAKTHPTLTVEALLCLQERINEVNHE